MSKQDNLRDYLADLYKGIASKKPGASKNPQDFRREIESIVAGEGGIDTSDATATPNQILEGATAYVNGTKITGTIHTYDGSHAGGVTASGVQISDEFPDVMEKDTMYGVRGESKICELSLGEKGVGVLAALLVFGVHVRIEAPITSVYDIPFRNTNADGITYLYVYPCISDQGFDLGEQYVFTLTEEYDINDIIDQAIESSTEPDMNSFFEAITAEALSKVYASYDSLGDAMSVDTIQIIRPLAQEETIDGLFDGMYSKNERVIDTISPLIRVGNDLGVIFNGEYRSMLELDDEIIALDPYSYINNTFGYFTPVHPFDDTPVGTWFKNNTSHNNPRWNIYTLTDWGLVPLLPALSGVVGLTNVNVQSFRRNSVATFDNGYFNGDLIEVTYPEKEAETGIPNALAYFVTYQDHVFMYNNVPYTSNMYAGSQYGAIGISNLVYQQPLYHPADYVTVDIDPVIQLRTDTELQDVATSDVASVYISPDGQLYRRSVVGVYTIQDISKVGSYFDCISDSLKAYFINENEVLTQYTGIHINYDPDPDLFGEDNKYTLTLTHSTDNYLYTNKYELHNGPMVYTPTSWELTVKDLSSGSVIVNKKYSESDVDPRVRQLEVVENIEYNYLRKFIVACTALTTEPKYVQYAAISEGGAST